MAYDMMKADDAGFVQLFRSSVEFPSLRQTQRLERAS
jgi:hypothetical protein